MKRRNAALELADKLADPCGGIIGADSDDTIGSIKVHYNNRPSQWLQDAVAEAVEAYQRARASKPLEGHSNDHRTEADVTR